MNLANLRSELAYHEKVVLVVVLAVHPDKFCITVWSPKLNPKGNSYKGILFLEKFTTKTESSIFKKVLL
jgi:hypothetical protein